MIKKKRKYKKTIDIALIAPCGMNCRLCLGFIREKNTCPGCRKVDNQGNPKSQYRHTCTIKNCAFIDAGKFKYCSEKCECFPCPRLKQLDKRYRTKYRMSMIDNLKMIEEHGVRHFIRNEKLRWSCPECGELFCVHKQACHYCGHEGNA